MSKVYTLSIKYLCYSFLVIGYRFCINVFNEYLNMQKMVFKSAMHDEKIKTRAMKALAGSGGTNLHYLSLLLDYMRPKFFVYILYIFVVLYWFPNSATSLFQWILLK